MCVNDCTDCVCFFCHPSVCFRAVCYIRWSGYFSSLSKIFRQFTLAHKNFTAPKKKEHVKHSSIVVLYFINN